MSSIFELSYYILIAVLGILGLVLFLLPTHKDPRLEGYRVSLRLMAVSFLSLALYCSFKWAIPRQIFSIYFLLMAHLQCILLGLGHLNLVAPKRVTKLFVLHNFVPLLCCMLLYAVTVPFCGSTALTDYAMLRDPEVMRCPEVFTRIIWMGIYIAHSVYVSVLFFRAQHDYSKREGDYFSDIDARALCYVRWSFIFVLCVALTTVFITASLHPVFSAFLNGCILIFYSLMGAFYIQYPKVFPTMEPIIYEKEDENEHPDGYDDSSVSPRPEEGEEPAEPSAADASAALWQQLRARILEEEIYTRNGLTMENLAREMTISRTRMSQLINRYEHCNFNTFINTLRIERACELLRTQPDIRLADLAERLGYADVSNFSRSFKLIRKQSPSDFRAGGE